MLKEKINSMETKVNIFLEENFYVDFGHLGFDVETEIKTTDLIFCLINKETNEVVLSIIEFIEKLSLEFKLDYETSKLYFENWVHGKIEILEPKIELIVNQMLENDPTIEITTEMIKEKLINFDEEIKKK